MANKRSWYGWVELTLGILLVLLGIYTFCNPTAAAGGIVIFYGLAAIFSGASDIAFYIKLERRSGFGPVTALVGGIMSILIGFLFLLNIRVGVFAFSFLFPIWFMIHCIARLSNLGLIRLLAGNASYWISLTIHILGLIAGFVLLLNPFASTLYMAYCAGLYLLLLGIGSIITSVGKLGAHR